MRLILSMILVLSAVQAWASDPFNHYQWNKFASQDQEGFSDRRPWFEWWYYKVIIPDTNKAYYFVYGVVNPWDAAHSSPGTRSYIGFGDFEKRRIIDTNYRVNDFSAHYDQHLVTLPGGQATDRDFAGAVAGEDGHRYSWDIRIDKRWSFNAEGWMLGTGLTQIEWYPAQADARCSGTIVVDGEEFEFADAPCYQDRNWGTRFPEWWAWIVSNRFDDHPGTSLAIGGGRPHLFGIPSFYEGVCIGLKHKGVEYAFRPNHFDKVEVEIAFGKWDVVGITRDGRTKIEINAYAPPEAFMDLQFMTPEGVVFHDYEALLGELVVKLYSRDAEGEWKLDETLSSSYAGIEFGSMNEQFMNALSTSKLRLQ